MKSLLIIGSYKGATGYDQHVREFVQELVNQGVTVQLVDLPKWSTQKLARQQQNPWYDTLQCPVESGIVLHFTMPSRVVVHSNKLNVNLTMFEATRIPQEWLRHNLQHDMVIVPAESSRQAWLNSGYPEARLRLCPLGVNPQVFHTGIVPLSLNDRQGRPISEYRTRILNISELIPRKNLIGLLRVWIQNTQKTDDAILVIKTSCPWKRWIMKFFLDLMLMEKQIGTSRKEAAPILFIINRQLAMAEMPRLYAAATHYWSMSHGEGWDLCMMEAGASGLHLIAPHHSGYSAYLDQTIADLIPSQQIPARFRWAYGLHRLFKDAEWWQPDEAAAAEYIRRAIDHDGEKKGAKARSFIIKNFTWQKATGRLIQILNELENQNR